MSGDPHNRPPDDEHKAGEWIKRQPTERLRSGTTHRLVDDREIAPGLERLKLAYRDQQRGQ